MLGYFLILLAPGKALSSKGFNRPSSIAWSHFVAKSEKVRVDIAKCFTWSKCKISYFSNISMFSFKRTLFVFKVATLCPKSRETSKPKLCKYFSFSVSEFW